MLFLSEAGLLLTNDFDADRGSDDAVLVDIETGEERARVSTGSPVQSVLFPAAGWHDDLYLCSFTTLTRMHSPGA